MPIYHSRSKQVNEEKSEISAVPGQATSILLHSCCAPCSGDVMTQLKEAYIQYTVLFYYPNIHPLKEYEIRKTENKRFADKLKIPFVDLDYNKGDWFETVKGYENEPERGYRCTLCFDMRFERTALYASENCFTVFSSTLGTSRWKNINQINACGIRAADKHENLTYWTINWRKKGGANRMVEISKAEKFYKQEYCGCAYSLRDTNKSRAERGLKPIEIGTLYYGK